MSGQKNLQTAAYRALRVMLSSGMQSNPVAFSITEKTYETILADVCFMADNPSAVIVDAIE
jgi:hypothetical protein